jgi:glycosyltransferase involved in cell wall biosynthesis
MSASLAAQEHLCSPPPARLRNGGRWMTVLTHLDPCYGGLSSAVPELASSVATQNGMAMPLAAFCSRDEQYSPARFPLLSIERWPAHRFWFLSPALTARFARSLATIDGLHIHGLWEQSSYVAARAARQRRRCYIFSAHGMLERWALANKRVRKMLYSALIERANLNGARCLHALTRAEADDYLAWGATRPVAIVPNGVHIPSESSPDLFLNAWPELRGSRIVLFLGRIHFKKGIDLLIRAWRRVAEEHRDAHLVLAGPDSQGMQPLAIRLIQETQLENRISFTGMLRDRMKWSALAAAECFVLPSYSEGLSVSALEAMAAARPVILSRACNLPEVAERDAGIVVQAAADPLADALGQILTNSRAANAAMGLRGRRLVEERYSWSCVGRQMSEVYAWALGDAPPGTVEIIDRGVRV